jgi:transposase
MHLLDKVRLLIRHTERAQARVAGQLTQQKQRHKELQETIEGLALQWREIDCLLQSQKLSGQVIDRAALFMLQQRQAVLRQQQYQLNFERDRLREETEALEKTQQESRAEIQLLVRKQSKFEHWSSVQKREQMLRRLQLEQQEAEDRIGAVTHL